MIIDRFSDHRGYITPLWRKGECDNIEFVEDRATYSVQDVIRGFHGDYRTTKLMTCIHGAFRLVVWDIPSSKIIWDEVMSAENRNAVLVYPNTLNAHQCLTPDCILYYKLSEHYDLSSQFSVNYNDKTINPQWSHIDETRISQRDIEAPSLQEFLSNAHS